MWWELQQEFPPPKIFGVPKLGLAEIADYFAVLDKCLISTVIVRELVQLYYSWEIVKLTRVLSKSDPFKYHGAEDSGVPAITK